MFTPSNKSLPPLYSSPLISVQHYMNVISDLIKKSLLARTSKLEALLAREKDTRSAAPPHDPLVCSKGLLDFVSAQTTETPEVVAEAKRYIEKRKLADRQQESPKKPRCSETENQSTVMAGDENVSTNEFSMEMTD